MSQGQCAVQKELDEVASRSSRERTVPEGATLSWPRGDRL